MKSLFSQKKIEQPMMSFFHSISLYECVKDYRDIEIIESHPDFDVLKACNLTASLGYINLFKRYISLFRKQFLGATGTFDAPGTENLRLIYNKEIQRIVCIAIMNNRVEIIKYINEHDPCFRIDECIVYTERFSSKVSDGYSYNSKKTDINNYNYTYNNIIKKAVNNERKDVLRYLIDYCKSVGTRSYGPYPGLYDETFEDNSLKYFENYIPGVYQTP